LCTGNLHKWAFVPRGCAVLWVHPDYQRDIFPVVTSLHSATDFDYNFSYQGTDDNSQYYTAKRALQFYQGIGGYVSFFLIISFKIKLVHSVQMCCHQEANKHRNTWNFYLTEDRL